MLSASFLKTASELLVPYAGTDLMAPLLYQLVRTTRPRSVLEAGSGYSTLFLLQALHDNAVEYEEQKKAFLAKTERLKVAMKEGGKPLWGDQQSSLFWDWMAAPPAHLEPSYFLREYRPHLYAFDDLSSRDGSASAVVRVARALGLDHLLTFVDASPIGCSQRIEAAHRPLDLIFNDAAEYEEFFEEYWEALDPRGGLMLFHNTFNSWSSSRLLVKDLKLRQAACPQELEVMSIVEPHKSYQGSFTMVRRISEVRERSFEVRMPEILANAEELLDRMGPSATAAETD